MTAPAAPASDAAPTTGPADTAPSTSPASPDSAEAPKPNVVPVVTPAGEAEPDRVDRLPQWAQKLIGDLRNGEASYRTKAKDADDRTKAILKAAGIETDETDPAKIAETATKAREAAENDAKSTRIELAVFKAAAAAGGDPQALLDSRGFLDSVKDVDPTNQAAIKAAITEAVTANPRLAAVSAAPAEPPATAPAVAPAPAAGASGADFTGGTGGAQQLSRDDLAGMTPDQILKAHKDGRLASLMRSK